MDQIGKYIVLEEIGQGGMGIVYKARDPMIGREVAVKVIPERIMRSPDLKERFLREIASAGRLSHENIMTIYDAGEHDERPYFVMELLSGTDLSSVIRQGTLSIDEKLAIALQVARGLRYAHERGVIHRDIKPDNVRVLANGKAKIMDFGIARVESATRTPTHSSIGTPRYMSPEQIKGENVDRRTDIFSFGALLYELLTRTPPFSGERITTVIYKILHEGPAPMELGNVPGAEALHRLVDKSLAKELDDRYASFDEVIVDIEAITAERNAVTPTVTGIAPTVIQRAESEIEHAEDETVAVPLPRDLAPPPPASSTDVTVIEPLPEALRKQARPERPAKRSPRSTPAPVPANPTPPPTPPAQPEKASKTAKGLPLRLLALGAALVVAALGLTYVIASPGDDAEPTPEEVAPPLEREQTAAAVPTDSAALATEVPTAEATAPAEAPATSEPEPSAPDEDTGAPRAAAETERSQMRSAKSRADRAGAGTAASTLYERAAAQERAGDAAFRRGTTATFAEASTAFAEATRLYDRARRTAAQRAEAEAAQQAAAQARAAVLGKRTDARIADDFQRAEAQRATAERQLGSADYQDATASFNAARSIYVAAAQTASRPIAPPVSEPEPAPPEPEPTPPQPSAEERALDAATQVAAGVASRLKRALESEDAGAMSSIHSTYNGWGAFFRIAENVNAAVGVGDPTVSGDRATVDVSLRIRFRNTSKNADETTNVRYRWTLAARGGTWTLTDVVTR